MSQASVVPILATPLGRVTLTDGPELNGLLIPWVQRMRAEDRVSSSALFYRGAEDLLERPEPSVRKLATEMMRGVYAVISQISELTEEDLRTLRPEARGWFTIVERYGAMPATNHPLTAWCAIYCMMAAPASPQRQDSGVVRFYQSGLGTMLQDATNSPLRMPFHMGHYSWRPVAGEMVVFPASTHHEIALLHAMGALMFATLKVRFVAPGQTGLSRW
jgi:hypothetical protein